MKNEEMKNGKGFTIVELLTVMGVIAILIGLLVPALNLVRDFAEEVEQKAQFHTLEVAIEMFSTEYGSYPPSSDNQFTNILDPTPYGGAQKLSEALVGWDLIGFHPKSDFRSDKTFTHDDGTGAGTTTDVAPAYHMDYDYAGGGNLAFAETAAENIRARTPFMELESANAYKMEDIYGVQLGAPSFEATNFVICDEYAKKRATGKKTGMPILYWRANTNITIQDSTTDSADDTDAIATNDDIYNLDDNNAMLQLLTAEQDTGMPRMDSDVEFDAYIKNDDIPTTVAGFVRPYRAQSYILISAGKDGYYGTADDVTNFDKKE
jgi:type II secretory pathway pseudopilin PulG